MTPSAAGKFQPLSPLLHPPFVCAGSEEMLLAIGHLPPGDMDCVLIIPAFRAIEAPSPVLQRRPAANGRFRFSSIKVAVPLLSLPSPFAAHCRRLPKFHTGMMQCICSAHKPRWSPLSITRRELGALQL
jgi:hypothetical protein